MFPMPPPEYFQVRDVEGILHVINRWMIARVEVRGTAGNLSRVETFNSSELDESTIHAPQLEVEVVCQAAGYVRLHGEDALNFLRLFYRGSHMMG
jgi:hypothetical protein